MLTHVCFFGKETAVKYSENRQCSFRHQWARYAAFRQILGIVEIMTKTVRDYNTVGCNGKSHQSRKQMKVPGRDFQRQNGTLDLQFPLGSMATDHPSTSLTL